MKRRPSLFRAVHRRHQRFVLEESAGLDVVIYARDIHAHDAAGAHVQMANLGVAHNARRKTDARARSFEQRVRVSRRQLVVKRSRSQSNSVAFTHGAVAPAVDDDERERPFVLGQRLYLLGILMAVLLFRRWPDSALCSSGTASIG